MPHILARQKILWKSREQLNDSQETDIKLLMQGMWKYDKRARGEKQGIYAKCAAKL